jgi:predicted TIM-barrel fold metal-dependent hydrolase
MGLTFEGYPVLDVHGHMSGPPQVRAWAYNLIALRSPEDGALELEDAELEKALERHLRILDERRIDLQLISPRPVAMMHWERPFIQRAWCRATNDVIAQHVRLHPDRFAGVAQLPQSKDLDTGHCLDELERCVAELGFVAALVNPDPAGDRQTPGMNDPYWFPLYERAEAIDCTLIVHPSGSKDVRLEGIPHAYQYNNLTEETLATMLLERFDVFERYPRLRVVVCHCGGALRRTLEAGRTSRGAVVGGSGQAGGGTVGMSVRRRERTTRTWPDNLFFDTCAYDPDFLEAAIRQRGVDQLVFGSEAPGSGTSVKNPETGRPSDDLVPVLERMTFLSADDRRKILHDNVLRVFPRLAARLRAGEPARA